jgi:hypothetical protein
MHVNPSQSLTLPVENPVTVLTPELRHGVKTASGLENPWPVLKPELRACESDSSSESRAGKCTSSAQLEARLGA